MQTTIKEKASTEKRLKEEVDELIRLLLYKPGISGMKFHAKWEKASCLSEDRNELVRLGIIREFTAVNGFINSILLDYFSESKARYPYRTKKYQLFETLILKRLSFNEKKEILFNLVKCPPSLKKFLGELERLWSLFANDQFPGMENPADMLYRSRAIYNLANFRGFLRDGSKATDFLIRQLLKGNTK